MSELTLERFEAFEKKLDRRLDKMDANHQELMLAVADVVTHVNDHIDRRFARLEQLLEVRDRVDKMQVLLAEQFGAEVLARAGL
ncbi:hypothetical protein KF840_19310 [bacterium]|nr:hypothetical protein [bacterium]